MSEEWYRITREEAHEMRDTLKRIANHFDQDGYGPDAWKDLALEMASIAKETLDKVEQAPSAASLLRSTKGES